jgi:cob(I)alamin adenosyltransferase
MGFRLSTIATRTGDDGTTGLGDGSRVAKDSARVAAMGDVDELNSTLGLLRCEPLPAAIDTLLNRIQNDLFDLGGELSIPGFALLAEERVLALDEALADYNAELPRLTEFILPGGSRSAAIAHVARTICRRAERTVISLASHARLTIGVAADSADNADNADSAAPVDPASPTVRPLAQQYLNRLSDLLFVLARTLNRAEGGNDVLWSRER